MLTHSVVWRGELIGESDDDGGSGDGSNAVYNGSMEPVLVLASDSYSENDKI